MVARRSVRTHAYKYRLGAPDEYRLAAPRSARGRAASLHVGRGRVRRDAHPADRRRRTGTCPARLHEPAHRLQYLGLFFYLLLIAEHSARVAVTWASVRKAVTVLITFTLAGRMPSGLYIVGAIAVLAAGCVERWDWNQIR